MPQNFLDLHIVDFCQLNCKHCYLNKGSRVMPLDMLRAICTDFLKTDFPLPQSELILSGGEPLLYPNFVDACNIVRKLNGHITMSTNGILIPKCIHTFERNDGIQVSIDGDRETHDGIRGKGSYDKAIEALECLQDHQIKHSICFALCKLNSHCIDHILALCKKYDCNVLNFGMYQIFKNKKSNKTVRFTEWLKAKEYVNKYVKTHVKCVETECVAGICGIAVTPDLYYWDCPRHQEIMGKYPQPIRDVLRDEDMMNPFDTCCKYIGW